MRKTIFTLTVFAFIATLIFWGCNSSNQKVEAAEDKVQDAKKDVTDAQQDLNKTIRDSIEDHQKFKVEAEEQINAHEKSIADFKERIKTEKDENKASYEKKLAELEQKNSDLKMKLEAYKEDGKDKWITFKNEFSQNMDELGKALKGFFIAKKK
jgi:DNA repair exonuclease SbcCD ATPase subunit